MEILMISFKHTWLAATLATLAVSSHATVIDGGSDLLTTAYAEQLTDWLGEGSLELTNIFTKVEDSTADDFHAAADGKGATFSVFEATSSFTGEKYIVGGYDPQSWNSSTTFNYSQENSERTAFIFNLTTSTVQMQIQDGQYYGQYQTWNAPGYGPSFGGGLDLSALDLSSGYAYAFSYGLTFGKDILGSKTTESLTDFFAIDKLEVFSISQDAGIPSAVPEPETYALMLAGLVAVTAISRRKRHLYTYTYAQE